MNCYFSHGNTVVFYAEITRAPNSGSCVGEQVTIANEPVADLVISEEKRTKSHSEEGDYYWNDNSEKSDFDSVDEDITKSMMALLLPLSVPLLTYTSRKKRRKTKSVKDLSCVPKQESNLNGPISSADVISPGIVHYFSCFIVDLILALLLNKFETSIGPVVLFVLDKG